MMHDHEKSDSAIVAVKPTNKAGQPAAELVEPRAGICFQYRSDAIRVQDALRLRLGKFGLTLESTKTKFVEFGRFAQRHAGKRSRKRPKTIYFGPEIARETRRVISRSGCAPRNLACGATLRLCRSLCGKYDITRSVTRWAKLTPSCAAIMSTTASPEIFGVSPRCTAPWSLLASDVAKPQLVRTSPQLEHVQTDQRTVAVTETKAAPPLPGAARCCESTAEERSAVNPHATFCGSVQRS
jgi:hypothetical protein